MKKTGTTKRLASALLALVMVLGMLPGTVWASNAYSINGVSVHWDDFSSSPNECWAYANNVYNKIWGSKFSNSFSDSNNSLRALSDSELTLTLNHLRTYVTNAALGSSLRVCNSEYLHGTDGWGHSQIIVQKDSNGFTVFEGGLSSSPYCREKYYTWSEYINTSWLGGTYAYIKYIKWPGAPAYNPTPITYANIAAGTYYLRNKSTGTYLNADGTENKANLSVANLTTNSTQRFVLSGGTSYSVAASFNSNLRVNPFSDTPANGTNVNLYSGTEIGSDMHWGLEAVTGGYVIHNMSYSGLVLGLDGTNVRVETKSGASDQIWELIPATYTISFNANGGTGAPSSQTKKYCEDLTLSSTRPTLSGYIFKGWATTASATAAQFQPGGNYNGNANATLYAVWEKEPEPVTLSSIAIATVPAKTVYEIGEALDTAGLTLTATYSDGSTASVTSGYTVSGFTSATAGEKTVTVTYEDKTTSFTVTVNEPVLTDEDVYTYTISDGEAAIAGYTGAGGNVIIPATLGGYPVTTIGTGAFANCTSLTGVVIPDSVTKITGHDFNSNYGAFARCTNLTSVTIGSGVTSIGDYTFYDCYNIQKVYIRDLTSWCGITFSSYYANPLYNGAALYIDGTAAREITIPAGVSAINAYAFYGCSRLQKVSISDGVVSINKYAFCNCQALTDVVIGDSVAAIGESAFNNCISLRNVTMGKSVTTIGRSVFYNCASIRSIDIGDDVTNIGAYAFCGCTSLTSVAIPDGVIKINEGTFEGCTSLNSVTISDSVTIIEKGAFYNCKSLSSVTIPDSVIKIESGSSTFTSAFDAFAMCTGLTSVTFEGSAPSIGSHVFYNVTATVYYPAGDDTWTEEVRQNYGGNLTWVAAQSVHEHTYAHVVTAPTCTERGYTTHTCADCGDSYVDTYTDALGHDWGEWVYNNDATKEADGTRTRVCKRDPSHTETAVAEGTRLPADDPAPIDPDAAAIYSVGVTGRPGETVTLPIHVRNNPGVAYTKLKINYDNALTLVSASNTSLLDGTFTTSKNVSTKPYVVTWTGTDDSDGNGDILELTFRIADTAEAGEYAVTIVCDEAYNGEFDDVIFAVEDMAVTVKTFTYGDVNDDDAINGKDAILLARYLAEWDVALNPDAADVNGDGRVNGKDAILLARYLAEWDVILGA